MLKQGASDIESADIAKTYNSKYAIQTCGSPERKDYRSLAWSGLSRAWSLNKKEAKKENSGIDKFLKGGG